MKVHRTVNAGGQAARRRGFTLIELLVVIAIIGILASLILPAVVNARRQGTKTKCLNNMKNVALGMFAMVGAKNQFPASGYWDVVTDASEANAAGGNPVDDLLVNSGLGWNPSQLASNPDGFGATTNTNESQPTAGLKYSWVVDLLPYIGNQALYDAWDFSVTNNGVGGNRGAYMDGDPSPGKRGNRDLANTYLEVLVCPDDTTVSQSTGSISYVVNGGFAPHWLAIMDYSNNGNTTLLRQGWHRDNLFKMGLMFLDTTQRGTSARRRHNLESVRDSVSLTVMLAENINAGPGSQWQGGIVTTNWACPLPLNTSFFVNPNAVFAQAGSNGDVQTGDQVLTQYGTGLYDYTRANNRGTAAPPFDPNGDQGGINGDTTGINEGQFPYPNSLHGGGVHVAMVDGSVRFLQESIAGEIWARLVTPDGGSLRWGNAPTPQQSLNFEVAPSGAVQTYQRGNRQIEVNASDL